MRPHERQVGTQVGDFLPMVTRHLRHERSLTVHDLVVTDGQDEILAELVIERKSDVAVVVFPIQGIGLHVLERVVHPSHVPFEAKSESAKFGRGRHATPAC